MQQTKNRSARFLLDIGIKVPDLEWEMTRLNVRPPASNENPDLKYNMVFCHIILYWYDLGLVQIEGHIYMGTKLTG